MNTQISNLSKITVAILAGGLGTRLKSKLKRKQKVLIEVGKHPFLEYLLHQLDQAHFKKIVLCTGYLHNQVEKAFRERYKNLHLYYSTEKKPLGTAGSLRNALPLIDSETILVMNGDSFCDVNFEKFWRFHVNKTSKATIVLSTVADTSRFGTIKLKKDDSIIEFQEKKGGTGLVNAGIYLIDKRLIAKIPKNKKLSLEKNIFPTWIGKGFYGYKNNKTFIDIGTPESYAKAQQFLAKYKTLGKKRFVILDRDGTIIKEKDHLTDINEVELIQNAASAIKQLNNLGLGIIILTNQSVVGRNLITLSDLELIHKKILNLLSTKGALVDAIYFCPHKPEDNCSCRKPKLGLIKKAIKDYDFDPELSFVIGDKKSDIELGKNIGATTILVRTGYGGGVEKEKIVNSDYVVDDLLEAANIIKRQLHH